MKVLLKRKNHVDNFKSFKYSCMWFDFLSEKLYVYDIIIMSQIDSVYRLHALIIVFHSLRLNNESIHFIHTHIHYNMLSLHAVGFKEYIN
jgi:hypothetical protein